MTPSKGNSSLSHHSHEKHRSNYGRVDDSLIWSQFGLPSDKPKLPSRRPGAHRPADDSTSNRNSVLRTEVEGTEFDYLSWVPHSWVVFFFFSGILYTLSCWEASSGRPQPICKISFSCVSRPWDSNGCAGAVPNGVLEHNAWRFWRGPALDAKHELKASTEMKKILRTVYGSICLWHYHAVGFVTRHMLYKYILLGCFVQAN